MVAFSHIAFAAFAGLSSAQSLTTPPSGRPSGVRPSDIVFPSNGPGGPGGSSSGAPLPTGAFSSSDDELEKRQASDTPLAHPSGARSSGVRLSGRPARPSYTALAEAEKRQVSDTPPPSHPSGVRPSDGRPSGRPQPNGFVTTII